MIALSATDQVRVQAVPFGPHKIHRHPEKTTTCLPQVRRAVAAIRVPRVGGRERVTVGSNTASHYDEEAIFNVSSPHPIQLFVLNPLSKFSDMLLWVVHAFWQQCRQKFFRPISQIDWKNVLSSKNAIYGVAGVLAVSMTGTLLHHMWIKRKKQRIQFLIWDAKELVPTLWESVEGKLMAAAVLDSAKGDNSNDPTMYNASLVQALLDQKSPYQDLLVTNIKQAKASQVVGIYQKHFPQEWKQVQRKHLNDNQVISSLARKPRLLRKLTHHIYRNKFTALLRPDYAFGIGRNGINLTKLPNTNHNIGMLVDPLLLKQVTEDLIANCSTDYPQIWGKYTSNLLPNQSFWDRHDLVLKMVKDVQLQKVKDGHVGNSINVKKASSWSGGGGFNNATTATNGGTSDGTDGRVKTISRRPSSS
ncbi:hypothetical protein IV203_013918 [Nitzschia inconspicua]|uniref:Uncharacterized protein n=1 Tax=Nitzschia inconspicua TaxID=303405 RepID=A0A9K3M701_9STRA|nr:hypothetical protein IV203_013918 [Nitzschia inconspicua]